MTEEQIIANTENIESKGPDVPCMLVPLVDCVLLLPTNTVAEMASMSPIGAIANAPNWLLGFFDWRNTRVPVISYEGINGGRVTPLNPQGRMAVLNNTGVDSRLPFVAIPTQGIPRMIRVVEEDITKNQTRDERKYDDMQVRVGMEELVIPNVAALEQGCLDTGLVITES